MQKQAVMKNRRNLKDNAKITGDGRFEDKVTLSEDLTAERHKLLKMCNEHGNVDFAYARDGVIICKRKNGAFARVNSPDDLFKLRTGRGHDS